jgi:hypothetical protein
MVPKLYIELVGETAPLEVEVAFGEIAHAVKSPRIK